MIIKDELKGLYEYISKLPQKYYDDLKVNALYSAEFDDFDSAVIEIGNGRKWFYIPTQDFLEHFSKVKIIKQKVDE